VGTSQSSSRPSRKNDRCFVEQKHYSVVRQAVEYLRLTTNEQLRCLEELYRPLNLVTNYFQPSTKLVKKTRSGSNVKKIYDTPQTPYQRLLSDPRIKLTIKKQLRSTYKTLNPAQLRREITRCQNQLNGLAEHTKHQKLIERRKPYVSISR